MQVKTKDERQETGGALQIQNQERKFSKKNEKKERDKGARKPGKIGKRKIEESDNQLTNHGSEPIKIWKASKQKRGKREATGERDKAGTGQRNGVRE